MSVTKLIPRYAYIYEDVEAAANDVGGKREFIYELDPLEDPPSGVVQVGVRVDNIDRMTQPFEEARKGVDISNIEEFKIGWRKIK